jgi:hypothetical protein
MSDATERVVSELAAVSAQAFVGSREILDFLPMALIVLFAAIVGAIVLIAWSLIWRNHHHAHHAHP